MNLMTVIGTYIRTRSMGTWASRERERENRNWWYPGRTSEGDDTVPLVKDVIIYLAHTMEYMCIRNYHRRVQCNPR